MIIQARLIVLLCWLICLLVGSSRAADTQTDSASDETTTSAPISNGNNNNNNNNNKQTIAMPASLVVHPLQQKVEGKIQEAVEAINQIIDSTSDSIDEYFVSKQKRVSETYAKMLADVEQEKHGASFLLDKMISNSKETVNNLQRYFSDVMDLTMEKTYADIKSILGNAVSKIDLVSRNIKDNLRATKDDLRVNHNLIESQKSLVKLINSGIDSIKKLAYKFKTDPAVTNELTTNLKEDANAKWERLFKPSSMNHQPVTATGGGVSRQLSARRRTPADEDGKSQPPKKTSQRRAKLQEQLESDWRREQELDAETSRQAIGDSQKRINMLAGRLSSAVANRNEDREARAKPVIATNRSKY